jgi:hypothetical protein
MLTPRTRKTQTLTVTEKAADRAHTAGHEKYRHLDSPLPTALEKKQFCKKLTSDVLLPLDHF